MHNNLNILEMKRVLELQPFIPNVNRLNIWQLNNLSHRLKGNLSKYKPFFPQPTPNCGSSCEKVTGSNAINVLNRAVGQCPPGAKAFLVVIDKRRSRLDSPFCIITQHRKFDHRQKKKKKKKKKKAMLRNWQLTQLSQTLLSAIAQFKVSNSPITNHTKKILPQHPPPFFNFCIT